MRWTTLYIAGRGDFRDEVLDSLEDSGISFMPGYTGVFSENEETHELYWIDERAKLRTIKEAIGSKLIWKFRLRFYPTLEALMATQNRKNTTVTAEDIALLDELRAAS
jgi:hypothetical protein